MSTETQAKYGQLVSLLMSEGHINEKQAEYASRIQSKLESHKSLLDVLKELEYITEDLINATIQKHQVSMPIGKMLVELGHITQGNLEKAIRIQKDNEDDKKLGQILVEHRFIDEMKFIEILSFQLGFKYLDPEFLEIDRALFFRAPEKWYDAHELIPIVTEDGKTVVAFKDPMDRNELEAAKQVFGNRITPAIARSASIAAALKKLKGRMRSGEVKNVDEDSVTGIVNSIILAAIETEASDIHIEPLQDRLRVRMRRDGVLVQYKDFPLDQAPSITSRFKIMCGADITEKRRHQGGRIFFEHAGRELDLRSSFYVTIQGEKIVLRLLNRQNKLLNMSDLGMTPKIMERFMEDALYMPSGVILITGPTGSGKTSTIYSCVTEINTPDISIS